MVVSFAVCLVLGSLLRVLTPARADAEVSCVLTESCILPCSFQGGTDVVIHWSQVAGNSPVHTFYHNQDQLARQDQHFSGRTSLFKDQISRGNASLRLTGVQVQDQGRYKCYTSIITGNKASFINLNVEALVHKVNIQQVENRITCSSEGIYPQPELTWSTSPPSNVTLQDKPTVQQTEQQLYSISSSLILSDSVTDLVYSCTVSTHRNWRRASWFEQTSISGCNTETTISCSSSNTSLLSFSLIWRFNHKQIILTQTGADVPYTVSEEWRQRVKGVSESGSLTLQDLSSDQEGIYTCERSDAEETHTFLRIEKSQDCSTNAAGVTGGVIVAILIFAVIVGLAVFYIYKKKKCGSKGPKTPGQTDPNSKPSETLPLNNVAGNEEDRDEGKQEPLLQ